MFRNEIQSSMLQPQTDFYVENLKELSRENYNLTKFLL